jgi:bile acid:Na+ symporter, BASS family
MSTQQLIILALKTSILLVVFGYGLRTTAGDVLYLVRRPALLTRSLVAMFVVMPIVAVLLMQLFHLRRPVEIALVTLALSPVPPLLPGKEGRAGGQSSYALGLLVVAGLLSIVVIPLGVALIGQIAGRSFAMPALAIGRVVLTMIVAPLALGMLVRAIAPNIATRITRPAALIGVCLLALGSVVVLVGVLPASWKLVGNGTLAAMAVFVAVGLAAGHWLAGDPPEHRTVLALSSASRHPAIALAIAKANFPDEPLLGPAILLYLVVSVAVSLPYVVRRKHTAAAEAAREGERSGAREGNSPKPALPPSASRRTKRRSRPSSTEG